jgi:hypothetical protein
MRIDQRNVGAAVTTSASFVVDRFSIVNSTDGAFSAQQDSSAPTGFVNSVKVTATTADTSLTAAQTLNFSQVIEGTNIADLGWGTANALPVTLSFWVRSSLTGTFGGSLRNNGATRSYPYSYTISAANTWEYKTITIPGDTAGTWLTTTGTGIICTFGLGAGPDRSGTAGAWASANVAVPTGAVSVIGTLNATWYVTGVQLETGSVATPFERRPYGTELMLCQRYYYRLVPGTTASVGAGYVQDAATLQVLINFPVSMRVRPSALEQTGIAADYRIAYLATATNCTSAPAFVAASSISGQVTFVSAAVLTAGHAAFGQIIGSISYLGWSAEL